MIVYDTRNNNILHYRTISMNRYTGKTTTTALLTAIM